MLDVLSLGRRPGSMRTVHTVVPAPLRIGLDAIAIEEGTDVELDLRLEAVSEGVLVTGTVRADTVGECSRCLEPFEDSVELYLTELFAYPDSVTEQTTDEDEVYRLVDDTIDLEPVIVDTVGLELPLRPLCSDDCAGLCPECGIRLAIAESGHGHERMDPRWAGLAAAFGAGSEEPSSASDSKNNEEK
ncbi:DUF177 domain-containing protein [Rhodococcus sp. 14C212]|nr:MULTISPECIES: YceD family protein [Rhodococcus]NGP09501.1 DUF177 domain-containing protein [Rhodococcus sp. 14C212]QRI79044.1 DUF177 domain-containing protein [Rhodococcus aetherivorans]QSE62267.1 DUF177 domain-containing protein [Rhodococcus sp. PSBB066]QSE71840.1 DUF177 domain-containing protein [Rhodococcus sp. PSBB049]